MCQKLVYTKTAPLSRMNFVSDLTYLYLWWIQRKGSGCTSAHTHIVFRDVCMYIRLCTYWFHIMLHKILAPFQFVVWFWLVPEFKHIQKIYESCNLQQKICRMCQNAFSSCGLIHATWKIEIKELSKRERDMLLIPTKKKSKTYKLKWRE